MSSTLLRTRRARVAEEMKPSARDGNTSRFHPPNPVAGNHPSFRENTKISMEASQKMGMETPPSATSIAPASTQVPRRSAETRPSPRPRPVATANAAAASSTDDPTRDRSRSEERRVGKEWKTGGPAEDEKK